MVLAHLGIVIAMYYNDHGPAHFHAAYGGMEVTVEIESGAVHGSFPRRALSHVQEWGALHRTALLRNWGQARKREPLDKISPLE
ncbi:MAG: DUF4160 domain-containing protein [Terriglobales bacterium]